MTGAAIYTIDTFNYCGCPDQQNPSYEAVNIMSKLVLLLSHKICRSIIVSSIKDTPSNYDQRRYD